MTVADADRNFLTCRNREGILCKAKNEMLPNGYAIRAHCGNCELYTDKGAGAKLTGWQKFLRWLEG